MNLTYLLNLLVTIGLIVPIAMIAFSRLLTKKTFIFLAIYYLATFVFNLFILQFIKASPVLINNAAIINNLLDGPLMLSFMILLAYKNRERKIIIALIALMLVFNFTTLAITGFTNQTIQICLGPSLLICFVFGLRYFVYYSKTNLRRSGGTNGKALIAGALVASYAAYIFVFLIYYVLRTNPIVDSYIIYCLLTLFSIGCMSVGLYKEIIRLRKIDEVQVMRKELAVLYEEDKDSPKPKRTRSLDDLFGFDPSEMVPGFRN